MLIVGRIVAGIGASGLTNGALTILSASVPLERRPREYEMSSNPLVPRSKSVSRTIKPSLELSWEVSTVPLCTLCRHRSAF